MKNIIIASPSRAGKSTLARRINEALGHFIIGTDDLAATFGEAYPELDIGLNRNRKNTTDNLAPFLGHYLGVLSSGKGATAGNRFVLEGGYCNFDIIVPILKLYGIKTRKENFMLVGLVQNQKTADEFFTDFRKHDTENDWTCSMNDDDLRYISEESVSFSRVMTAHLTKHSLTIFDASFNRERVLAQILKDIKSETI